MEPLKEDQKLRPLIEEHGELELEALQEYCQSLSLAFGGLSTKVLLSFVRL
ncbi:MAG: hypothetical protein ABEK00_03525 [Candidatus Nanohaloarchaea archaeon]